MSDADFGNIERKVLVEDRPWTDRRCGYFSVLCVLFFICSAIGLGDLSLPALVAGPIADARAKLGLRWLVLKVPRDYDERAVADACRGGTWRVSSVESVRKMKLVILVACHMDSNSPTTAAPAAPQQGGRYVPPHRRSRGR